MIRLQFLFVALSLMLYPLVDATIKGTLVLLCAGAVCLMLRRDSAATRHVVWATAVMLVLAMPLLSSLLPQWRVLPNWSPVHDAVPPARSLPTGVERPDFAAEVRPQHSEIPGVIAANNSTSAPPAAPRNFEPQPTPPAEARAKTTPSLLSRIAAQPETISLIWLGGALVVFLRLLTAALVLQKSASRCRPIASLNQANPKKTIEHSPADDSTAERQLRAALEAAAAQMGIRRSAQLLLDPHPTMPVVWGLLRPRMRLPADAVHWSLEQQQSVLLHELAHIRRNDLLILTMTQFACALNWFNPAMWLAAWRLHVECERACDDLVLSAGIRPSTYAKHIVEIVSRVRPVAWARSCGLAMARKSSLESRLTAVLSHQMNRRRLTRLLVTAVFLIGTLITIPVAMLRATGPSDDTKPTTPKKSTTDEPQTNRPQPPAEEKSRGKAPATSPAAPQEGTELDADLEAKLQWGEPTSGLRMALIRPPALGEPEVSELFDFKLVVQNVSDGRIQFSNASATTKNHYLFLRRGEGILSAFHDPEPKAFDFTLEPRHVAIVDMFPDGINQGSPLAKGAPELSFSARLTIENAPQGLWTGKLVSADTQASGTAFGLLPKQQGARALFIAWNRGSRWDGTIPGGFIALLADSVKTFTENNPTWRTTPQLLEMLSRFDSTHDWRALDALTLLDELAAVQTTPIDMAFEHELDIAMQTGTPLPRELASAPWSKALPNGLRLAWLFEPRGAKHPLNTPLKSRVLIHNAGRKTVVFRTRSWHQVNHKATTSSGNDVPVNSVDWTTIGRLTPFRLAPGEFIELNAAGVGVGPDKDYEDWQNTRVGTWLQVEAGDVVTLNSEAVPLSDWNERPPPEGDPGWWLGFVKSRLAREVPLPTDAEVRRRLLYHVALDLFGTPLSDEEMNAFVMDIEPNALESLAERLARSPRVIPYSGTLESAPTKFLVVPADPDAATRPRTASNPGRYTLGENIVLEVSRRPIFERMVNTASIHFFSTDPAKPPPGEPRELSLPDGYDTWAVAWLRGGNILWQQEVSGLRSYDFSDPANVIEKAVEADQVPAEIRTALQRAVTELRPPPRGGESAPPADSADN